MFANRRDPMRRRPEDFRHLHSPFNHLATRLIPGKGERREDPAALAVAR